MKINFHLSNTFWLYKHRVRNAYFPSYSQNKFWFGSPYRYYCIFYSGQEKSEFWALLGGKTAYTDERILKTVGEAKIPRLFHGSNASGNFKSKFLSRVFYSSPESRALVFDLLLSCYILVVKFNNLCFMGANMQMIES